MGVWCNGSIVVSKTIDEGSIPSTPAKGNATLDRKDLMASAEMSLARELDFKIKLLRT